MIRHLEGMGRRNMHKKTMVDLGCGTGVVGICAGVLGANVLLTDMDHALDLPRRNQARNLQAIKAGGGKVESAVHVWGSDVAPLLASLGGKQAQQPVDFVVACEVVYQPESYPSLVKSISDLSGPKTVVRDRENRKHPDDLELFDCPGPQIGDISIGARPRFFSPCGGGTTQRLTHSLR
jgi:predicted nicotinamide N-methyase